MDLLLELVSVSSVPRLGGSARLTTFLGTRYVALHHAVLAPNVACRLAAARIWLRNALVVPSPATHALSAQLEAGET